MLKTKYQLWVTKKTKNVICILEITKLINRKQNLFGCIDYVTVMCYELYLFDLNYNSFVTTFR